MAFPPPRAAVHRDALPERDHQEDEGHGGPQNKETAPKTRRPSPPSAAPGGIVPGEDASLAGAVITCAPHTHSTYASGASASGMSHLR